MLKKRTVACSSILVDVPCNPIPGCPGYYATTNGDILSKRFGRVMQPFACASGHLKVDIYIDGTPHAKYIHRLVLRTFVGPCPPREECLHNNGDPGDNRIENLRWGTHKENGRDMVKHGAAPKGEQHPNAKLSTIEVKKIQEHRDKRVPSTAKKLAQIYGVGAHCIRLILNGRHRNNG